MGMIEHERMEYETAVLVGLVTPQQDELKLSEYLDELEFLAQTAGARVVKRFWQKLDSPNPRTFVGTGKLEEIKTYLADCPQVDVVIFDDELSAGQLRNIERELGRKILDRTNLILDIFAARAQTSYARTQVELAQYQYLLPRLTGMWTHLERQRGGIGMRGPGETEIETDRRIVRDRIALLKEKLSSIDRQMATQRKNRGKTVRVALVGYTNVGKSTLMNLLSKSDVFAENKLFATLDTTVRKVVIANLPILLTDTVGFIRKLPTELVESFKSTLDEVREADLLVHVADISHPGFEDHIASVRRILSEIGASDKPTIMAFNKIDAYRSEEDIPEARRPGEPQRLPLVELERSWMARTGPDTVFISAARRENIDALRRLIYDRAAQIHVKRFPYNDFLFEYFDEDATPKTSLD